MSLSLLASRSISTDRRHIDPNPDRLPTHLSPAQPPPPPQRPVSVSLPASSLLLLSTSAEAAVLESRKFEKGSSRPSSSVSHPHPHPHSSKPPASFGSRRSSQQQQRVHHRLAEAVAANPAVAVKRDFRNVHHTFKCEKCPKVYRHPQCLVKHRWEHTSYWADASKLMLSKHQQVQMLEAAAILATPSGSLPESRSLWPAAVSPSEAGLLGSDQVNLDVIQSQVQSHRSSSSPCSSVLTSSTPTGPSRKLETRDVEMAADEETGDEAEESDGIMFEMSINGDDSQSSSSMAEASGKRSPVESRVGPISFSISAPPPMGYFEPRATNVTTLEPRPEPFIAYSSRRTSSISIGRSYYKPDTVFHPPPYADSGLRFQGDSRLEEKALDQGENEEEDDDDGFGIREVGMNGIGDEVVGMEL